MIEQLRSMTAIGAGDRTSAGELCAHVIATTNVGTRAALEAAHAWASGLDLQVVLLVPQVIPYADPLDQPADSVAFAANRFRELADALHIDVLVRVCVCRPHSAELRPLLPRDGIILVGGRVCRWWPTREERLARRLDRDGYRVIFVGSAIGSSRAGR
jgi:hypothetical protein